MSIRCFRPILSNETKSKILATKSIQNGRARKMRKRVDKRIARIVINFAPEKFTKNFKTQKT